MAAVDELIVQIKADTKGLKKGLDGVNKSLNRTSKTSKAAGAAMKKLAALAAVYFSAKTVSSMVKVTATFEDLKDSLDTVFGSMKKGDAAFERIMKFAQTTPFQIETVTQAFISLKAAGIEPSEEMLRIFGNTASVTSDKVGTFNALIRLTQRSASGGLGLEELNMISDRGIDVLGILAAKLDLAKDEIATFGSTAEGARIIVKALMEGLNEKFPDTMGRYMDNLSTKSSNLTIAFKRLSAAIMTKTGGSTMLKASLDFLTRAADDARNIMMGDATFASTFFTPAPTEEPEKKASSGKRPPASEMRYVSFAERMDKNRGGPEKRAAEALLIEEKRRQSVIKFAGEFASLADAAADPLVEIAKQIEFIETISRSQQEMDLLGTNPEQLAEITEHLQGLAKEATETSDTIGLVLAQSISDSAQAFSTTFVDGVMSGRSALASFGDFAKDIVKQIIATFLQMAVVNEILNKVFGGMGGFTQLPTMRKAAGGGTVQSGQPTLVGERGAEIFVPNSSGRIMNNADSQGGGGGVTINQSINFSTGVVATVRAEVGRMMPQIADTTKAAVLEASQRGGSFRKGLMGAT